MSGREEGEWRGKKGLEGRHGDERMVLLMLLEEERKRKKECVGGCSTWRGGTRLQ